MIWKYPSKGELPENKSYCLVKLNKDNWFDYDAKNEEHYFKVVKFERGISELERELLKNGTEKQKDRARTYCDFDQHANNWFPYNWKSFGPGDYFGQEVICWMYISELPQIIEEVI